MVRTRSVVQLYLLAFGILFLLGCSSEPTLDRKTVGTWIDLLRHDDWTVQEEAQNALTRMGKTAVPYLTRGLRTKDPTLRRGIVRTLGKIGPDAKSCVPMLLSTISREKVALIRASIIEALTNIDPTDEKVRAEFTRRLKDVDPDVRKAADLGLNPPMTKSKIDVNPVEKKSAQVKMEFVLRDEVKQKVEKISPGTSFGMIAEVARADRRAAIVWPGIMKGKILDDDVVAFIFEKSDKKGWAFLEQVGPLRGSSEASAKLSKALGGPDDQRVARPCGVAKKDLQDFVNEHVQGFSSALKAGQAEKAMDEFEKLNRAFSFSLVAFDDFLPHMLSQNLDSWKWNLDTSGEGNELPLHAYVNGKNLEGLVELRPCGDGVVIGKITESRH